MLPWKLQNRQILPVNKNLSSVYFPLAKFQLVSRNPFLTWFGEWHILTNCQTVFSHLKWQMSSFTYQRPTCKGHDTIQQQRLKLYPTLQKHTHHQSIAVNRGQSVNSLQLLIPNNNNSVKGSCNHHYSYYIKQQRKTKRSAAADIHQISLSKQIIISTYNDRSLHQLGKLNELCCVEAGGRSRSWSHWCRKASPYLIHSDNRTVVWWQELAVHPESRFQMPKGLLGTPC